jgi:hypothetical protein
MSAMTSSSENAVPNESTAKSSYRLPSDTTLKHACKLAIVEDKPLLMDYWPASLENKALVGVRKWRKITCKKRRRIYVSYL